MPHSSAWHKTLNVRGTEVTFSIPSPPNGKKYKATWINKKNKRQTVYFGDRNYGQYKDRLGYYRAKDHLDKSRRKNYNTRHTEANKKVPFTAAWFSAKCLW